NKTIQESHDWHGLDLATRDAKQWGFRPDACVLVGDNWIFGAPDPKKDSFTLVTSFPHSSSTSEDVTLHCLRRSRSAFELESIEIEEHEKTSKHGKAQQGVRANDHGCPVSCCAGAAPAIVVAHLSVRQNEPPCRPFLISAKPRSVRGCGLQGP